MCHCYGLFFTNKTHKFKQYNPSEDRLGSEWDSFYIQKYQDEEGKIHEIYIHDHLGLIRSYQHIINEKYESFDSLPKTWKLLELKQDQRNQNISYEDDEQKKKFDNETLVPIISKYLIDTGYGEKMYYRNIPCKTIDNWGTDKCEDIGCKKNHDKFYFTCPKRRRCNVKGCGYYHPILFCYP